MITVLSVEWFHLPPYTSLGRSLLPAAAVPMGSLPGLSGAAVEEEGGRERDEEDELFFPSTLSCFIMPCFEVSFDPASITKLLRFEMPFSVLSPPLDLGFAMASAPIGCSLFLACS